MGELRQSVETARAELQHAAALMRTKGQTKLSRKQVSRLFADRALALADVAVEVAQKAEELAEENARLKAAGEHTEAVADIGHEDVEELLP